MDLLEYAFAIPARIAEHAGMLGADDDDRVERQDQLGVMQRAQAAREGVGQAVRVAGELIDNATRPFASEDRNGIGAIGNPASGRQR